MYGKGIKQFVSQSSIYIRENMLKMIKLFLRMISINQYVEVMQFMEFTLSFKITTYITFRN
jgi:hypothetical protein